MKHRVFREDLQAVASRFLRAMADRHLMVEGLWSPEAVLSMLGMRHSPAGEAHAQALINALPEFLAKAHVYQYPKADNTSDAVVFGLDLDARSLKVLLIERGNPEEPYYGFWALPGGFINMNEDLATCARRELVEETQVDLAHLEQLYTFSAPDRDPRGRVISVAYWALVRPGDMRPVAADDAKKAAWFSIEDLPGLAFDHREILDTALRRIRGKIRYEPVGVHLLPESFTLAELQSLYEIILNASIDRRNFRKKLKPLIDAGVFQKTAELRKTGGLPAACYRYQAENLASYDDGLEMVPSSIGQ